VNIKELKELIELMDDHGLMEIEMERQGMKIKLRRGGPAGPMMVESAAAPVMIQQPVGVPAAPASAPAAPEEPAGTVVKSPMVGTFYRSPSPDSDPFVSVGQQVEVGQVLCIVEAMKLMNEIKSEVSGKILKIPVENAEPIEFGQPLFIIEMS